ncbi:MAG: Gfo/Idh/MocA family protein [Mangrovibacterium sp.]
MENKTVVIKAKPRLAFVGAGWIGLNRMKSLIGSGLCEAAAIVDPVQEHISQARELAPEITSFLTLDEVIESRPDGIIIATPSALHAAQCIQALDKGIPVFCQKPLARTSAESRSVIAAAQKSNCLLGVDLSYRFTDGMQRIYELVHTGKLGKIFAVDLVFHNAYGPDKAWFYDPALSGGGCLIDLGIHLVDLALWMLDFPGATHVSSSLMARGKPLSDPQQETEDYISSQFTTSQGASVRLACSWNLPAGKNAEIRAFFYGTQAAAGFSNVNGSFYDFEMVLCQGTSSEVLIRPPDDWGGKALREWTIKLTENRSFNPEINTYLQVAETIDRIYGRLNIEDIRPQKID